MKTPALVFKEATLRAREVALDKAQAWGAEILLALAEDLEWVFRQVHAVGLVAGPG